MPSSVRRHDRQWESPTWVVARRRVEQGARMQTRARERASPRCADAASALPGRRRGNRALVLDRLALVRVTRRCRAVDHSSLPPHWHGLPYAQSGTTRTDFTSNNSSRSPTWWRVGLGPGTRLVAARLRVSFLGATLPTCRVSTVTPAPRVDVADSVRIEPGTRGGRLAWIECARRQILVELRPRPRTTRTSVAVGWLPPLPYGHGGTARRGSQGFAAPLRALDSRASPLQSPAPTGIGGREWSGFCSARLRGGRDVARRVRRRRARDFVLAPSSPAVAGPAPASGASSGPSTSQRRPM